MSAYFTLKGRRRKFVDAYVEMGIGTKAIVAAGYKGKRANQAAYMLLQEPPVQAAIAERKAEAMAEAGRTAVQVLEAIGETLDRCLQHVPVRDKLGNIETVTTPDGQLAAAYTFDAKNALKAAELLGDFHKLFVKRLEHAGPNGQPLPPPVFNLTFPDGGPGERAPTPEA